jgi:hypothetical protein
VFGSSNFCRRPCLTRQGFLRFSHCLRRQGEEACRVPHFLQGSPVAGRGEACKVPPISAGVPASHVRSPPFLTLPQASGGGSVSGASFFAGGPCCQAGGRVYGSSNFCRHPCLTRQLTLHFSHCLRRLVEEACRVPYFLEGSPAARRGEACMVPPISAGAPASRVRVSYVFHIASGVRGRKRVGFLIFCRGPRWLVGGKRVWFLQISAGVPASHVRVPSISHIASGVRGEKRVRCPHFLQGFPAARRGGGCMVPQISAGVLASCVSLPSVFHIASRVRWRKIET